MKKQNQSQKETRSRKPVLSATKQKKLQSLGFDPELLEFIHKSWQDTDKVKQPA